MANWRVSLGLTTTGSNLVTNGTFTGGLAGWTADAGWTGVGNIADFTPGGGGGQGDLSQASVFEVGKRYRVTFDNLDALTGVDTIGIRFGDFGFGLLQPGIETVTQEHRVLSGTSISFHAVASGATSVQIDNVVVLELDYNTPITDQPIGLDEAKIVVQKDRDLEGLITKFITELTFWGDGYDYIKAQFDDSYCNKIPVLFEYKCTETAEFERFFEGHIYISDCTFDLQKCMVKCTVEDSGGSQLLQRNKNVKVFADAADSNETGLVQEAQATIDLHDNTGAYPAGSPYNDNDGFHVGSFFRTCIQVATELEVDCDTDYFELGGGGDFEDLCIILGKLLRTGTLSAEFVEQSSYSFKEFFQACNSVFNLGIQSKTVNGVPIIKIEPKEDLFSSTSILTLVDVPNIKAEVNKDLLFKTISIGYSARNVDDDDDRFQYVTNDTCSDKDLNLISKFVAQSILIEELLNATITGTEYDKYTYFIECTNTGGFTFDSTIFGGNAFNGNLEKEDNMLRWVDTLPASTFKNRDTGEVITKTNPPQVIIYKFDYPLSKTQFDSISDVTRPITFSGAGITTPLEGHILKLEYNIKTGLTSFELLSE